MTRSYLIDGLHRFIAKRKLDSNCNPEIKHDRFGYYIEKKLTPQEWANSVVVDPNRKIDWGFHPVSLTGVESV